MVVDNDMSSEDEANVGQYEGSEVRQAPMKSRRESRFVDLYDKK